MVSLIWRVNIVTMLFFALIQVVVPLIPRYALTIGASPIFIGLAVSSVSVTAILFRPFSGMLSDKGSRSRLMMLGIVCGSIGYFLLSFSTDVTFIMISRLIEGLGVALFIPSSIASAVDQAPPGKMGETLGWRSLMVGVGLTIGPALGGFLSGFFGYRITFALSAALFLLLIPLTLFKENERKLSSSRVSLGSLKERGFIISTTGLTVYALAWSGLLTFLSAYLKIGGYGDLEIGLFFSIEAVSSLALRVVAGRMADRNPAPMSYLGLIIISLSFFLIYLFQVPPYIYIAAAIFGVGIGIYIPGAQTLALSNCPQDCRGLFSSMYSMGMDVGNLIGPLMFGVIIQSTGSYPSVFAAAPVLTFIAAMIVFIPTTLHKRTKVDNNS